MAVPISRIEQRFEALRRPAGFAIAPLACLAVWLTPIPSLDPVAHRMAAMMVLAILLWVSEAIPMAATALLVPALCIVTGIGGVKQVLAPFASSITFLFIGTFMLGIAMQKHGLDRRMALRLLSLPGVARSTTTLFVALGGLTTALSMWMSNAGTTAVMLPIALGVLSACPEFGDSPGLRENLVLLIAFGASMGGLATPVGTPPNLIALAALREHAGMNITFFEWMQIALPLTVVLTAFLFWLMRPPRGPRVRDPHALRTQFLRDLEALGPLSRGEACVAAALGAAIVLWVYPGLIDLAGLQHTTAGSVARWIEEHFPEDIVGLLVGLSLLVVPVDLREWKMTLEWREAVRIDWGTILLFAGGLSLGALMFQTGLAAAFGSLVTRLMGGPDLWMLVGVAIVASIALSEAASNTASATIMAPTMIAVAQAQGVNPVPVALATTLACSFGFLLPVSTGPNAQAFATGHVRIVGMMRKGIWLDIVGAGVIWLVVRFLAPFLGWS